MGSSKYRNCLPALYRRDFERSTARCWGKISSLRRLYVKDIAPMGWRSAVTSAPSGGETHRHGEHVAHGHRASRHVGPTDHGQCGQDGLPPPHVEGITEGAPVCVARYAGDETPLRRRVLPTRTPILGMGTLYYVLDLFGGGGRNRTNLYSPIEKTNRSSSYASLPARLPRRSGRN